MTNPYSPSATDFSTPSSGKVYSAGHVAWAAFLGGPLAGCVLLAINYRRFGDLAAANIATISGIILTALLFALAFMLPDSFPSMLLPAAYTYGMYEFTKGAQGNASRRHLSQGGAKASAWAATGIGMLFAVVMFVAMFAFLLAMPVEWLGDDF